MDGDPTASGNGSFRADAGACDVVRDRLSDLLAGDLPVAMRRELELHARACERCTAEVAAGARVLSALRALPTQARRAEVWRSIERSLAREPVRRREAFAVEAAVLIVVGVALASTLALRNDAIVRFAESHLADGLRRLLLSGSLRACLLPTLFALFGAIVAVVALPLLTVRRPALPVLALATIPEKAS